MPPARPLILGHRGDATRSRENTLASFGQAERCGADGIEFDVRASSDGLVVHHDATLRLAGRRVAVSELGDASKPAWMPSLGDVVAWARTRDLVLDVEIKEPGIEERVLQACRPLLPRCVFTSFHPDVVQRVRELAPRAKAGWITKAEAEAIVFVATELRPRTVVLPARRCTSTLLAALAGMGSEVWAWNANEPQTAERLRGRGVRALITDQPARLVAWRDARPRSRTIRCTGRRENSAGRDREVGRRT